MRGTVSKKIRQAVRRQNKTDYKVFVEATMSLPISERFQIAWKIVRGKV